MNNTASGAENKKKQTINFISEAQTKSEASNCVRTYLLFLYGSSIIEANNR